MTTGTLEQFDTMARVLRVYHDLPGEGDVVEGQRRGQYVFNMMAEAFPQVAEPLRGSIVDPFYQNFKIAAFLDACETRALEVLS